MSVNLAFQYVKDVLTEDGPLTGDEITAQFPDWPAETVSELLMWAVDNGSLTVHAGVYELTERGRR